jgi:hypothetical protein
MNFKTTIVLIALLVAVGAVLYFTRDRVGTGAGTEANKTESTASTEKKFLEVRPADVKKLVITPADGKAIALEKIEPNKWRMTQPVNAAGDASAVDSLISSLGSAQLRGALDPATATDATTGLNRPEFVVELTDNSGKATKLTVGTRSAIGGNVYAKREGDKDPQLVSADLIDALEKSPDDLRDKRLVSPQTPEVREIKVATTQGSVELKKEGADWQIVQGPTTMPADPAAALDLVGALTGLRAEEFLPDDPSSTETAQRYQLDQPAVSVSYVAVPTALPPPATTQATTSPATQPSSITGTLKFGRYDGVLKKSVFVTSSESHALAKVPASSLESFQKKPLDLRDKRVVNIDPEQVQKITITTDRQATITPPRAASSESVTIVRAAAPATAPSTAPTTQVAATEPAKAQASATTQPSTAPVAATAPAEPPSKWQFASASPDDRKADDTKVSDLLTLFEPLRATKFVGKPATTQPTEKYTLTITTSAGAAPATHTFTVVDPGSTSTSEPTADYNGLTFEVSRSLVDRLQGGFAKTAGARPLTPAAPPAP